MRNRSIPVGTFRPRAFARSSTCFGERMLSATTSSRSRPSRNSAAIAALSSCQCALGAARRECVAGHDVTVLQRALRLIVQRGANVLDRVDEG